jgi:hypothetical protein
VEVEVVVAVVVIVEKFTWTHRTTKHTITYDRIVPLSVLIRYLAVILIYQSLRSHYCHLGIMLLVVNDSHRDV